VLGEFAKALTQPNLDHRSLKKDVVQRLEAYAAAAKRSAHVDQFYNKDPALSRKIDRMLDAFDAAL
jgi:hypothetical protein